MMDEKCGGRLVSLDVLRGFDMFFIVGGGTLLTALCEALGAADGVVARQLRHAEWAGFTFEDTIFPLFLFIAGASFPFSAAKRLAHGATAAQVARHAVRRGLSLVFLGLVYGGVLRLDFANQRWFGVLQLIGFAWTAAALLYLGLGRRARALTAVGILVGTSLAGLFVGTPDFPDAAPFSPEGNVFCWLDRTLFGSAHLCGGVFDPEGTASLLTAVATAMLGTFAGELLRSALPGAKKAAALLGAAAAFVGAGLLLAPAVPVVKSLWTASFALVAAGYSAAMLALFYYAIDVRGLSRGTLFFKVIGMNAIAVYLVQRVVGFGPATDFLFGGAVALCPQPWDRVAHELGYVAVVWAFLHFLYRKGVFLKV